MRKFLFSFIVCFVCALVAGAEQTLDCAAKSIDPSESIQPRNEGSYWFYKSVYFEDGKAYSNGTTKEEVIEVRELDGMKCWKVKLTMDWRSMLDRLSGAKLAEEDLDYYWEYFDDNGSYHYANWDCDTGELPAPVVLKDFALTLPYPVKSGHTYEADGESWTVLDDNKVLKVPAGEFTCIVYQSLYEDPDDAEYNMRSRFYMCPGVGMVRYELVIWIDGDWELDLQDSLIKYDLKLLVLTPEAAEGTEFE